MPKVLTANRLADGRVVYLAADGRWSGSVGEAAPASDEAAVDALLSQGQQAEARCEVVGAYLIDVMDGNPVEGRERIRAFGPTVQTPTP